MSRQPRPLVDDEIGAVAALWHDTWHSSHDHLAPRALCEFRTRDYFSRRTKDERAKVRVSGSPGAPIGLCIASGGNLDMLFVASSERGKGIGKDLLEDAEKRMKNTGIKEAHLYVALGNVRAIQFYKKNGWVDGGKVDKEFEVAGGMMKDTVLKMSQKLMTLKLLDSSHHAVLVRVAGGDVWNKKGRFWRPR